jgi:uncharacterized membrane protein
MKYLLAFLVSMVPIVELRGAIPFGLSNLMGGPLELVPLYILCILGNMLPVPFIFFFARKILVWGAERKWSKAFNWLGKFFKWILKKGEKGGKKLTAKTGQSVYIALLLFVGIPLPGTGAWTGTLAASLLDLDFKKSVISIMLGVLLAGIIMSLGSFGIFSLF